MSQKRSMGWCGRSGGAGRAALVWCGCALGVVQVALAVNGKGASLLARANAPASIVVTQVESRALPVVWLLNLVGQQSIAHQQVFSAHDVSGVAVFDGDTLAGVEIVYLSPSTEQLELTTIEIDALEAFVMSGGRLIIPADAAGLAADFADLAARFDVTYGEGCICVDVLGTVEDFANPITNGPGGVVNVFGASAPNNGLDSSNNDFLVLARWPEGEVALGFLLVGAGEVIFLTDFNTFDDVRFDDFDNQVLWTNLFAVPCPADLDGSGAVDVGDLLAILAAWGNKGGPEDLDGSGFVDIGDILAVLANWGPCE